MDPQSAREPALEQVEPGTLYTCPMHPEIEQDHPGICPKCGMALEPMMPRLEDDNLELKDFSHRFWRTLPFTIVVIVLGIFGPQSGWFDISAHTRFEFVLTLAVG